MDGIGGQGVGVAELEPLGGLGGEKSQLVEDLGRAVGVQGTHRAGGAGVHGVEHWHDLDVPRDSSHTM